MPGTRPGEIQVAQNRPWESGGGGGQIQLPPRKQGGGGGVGPTMYYAKLPDWADKDKLTGRDPDTGWFGSFTRTKAGGLEWKPWDRDLQPIYDEVPAWANQQDKTGQHPRSGEWGTFKTNRWGRLEFEPWKDQPVTYDALPEWADPKDRTGKHPGTQKWGDFSYDARGKFKFNPWPEAMQAKMRENYKGPMRHGVSDEEAAARASQYYKDQYAEDWDAIKSGRKVIEANRNIRPALEQMKGLLDNPNLKTGERDYWTLRLRKLLQGTGTLTPQQEENADLQTQFQALVTRIQPNMRTAGAGTSTDKDVEIFLSSIPNMMNSPNANREILTGMLQAQDHQEAIETARRRYFDDKDLGNASLKGWEAYRKQQGLDGLYPRLNTKVVSPEMMARFNALPKGYKYYNQRGELVAKETDPEE